MIRIQILHGSEKGRRLDFNKDIIYIGRSKDNDIQMKNLTVSRSHLRIMNKRGKYYIEDLNSTNGAYYNGGYIEPGTEIEIKKGLPIIMGITVFSVGEAYPGNVAEILDDLYLCQDVDKNRKIIITDNHVEHIKNQDLMSKISNLLIKSLNITQTLEKILEYLFEQIHTIDRGAFILIDEDTGNILKIVSKLRNDKNESVRMYSRTLVNRVIQERKLVFVSNNHNHRGTNFSESMEICRVTSASCIPLKRNSKIYGVIYADSFNETKGFTKKDLSILSSLIGPVSILVENAWLNATREIKRDKQTENSKETANSLG